MRLTRPPRLRDPPPHTSRRHGTTNLLHRATREGKKIVLSCMCCMCTLYICTCNHLLVYLCVAGNYKVVSELLKCQYRSLDAKNEDGQTAVHVASRLGQDDILKKLIESNANINCRDTAGYTPLHVSTSLIYLCTNFAFIKKPMLWLIALMVRIQSL